jgi:hypothetical protein
MSIRLKPKIRDKLKTCASHYGMNLGEFVEFMLEEFIPEIAVEYLNDYGKWHDENFEKIKKYKKKEK